MPATASEPARRARGIRWTIRLRLTVIYGALFLASGVGLLAVTYALVAGAQPVLISNGPTNNSNLSAAARQLLQGEGAKVHAAELRLLLTRSAIALAIMAAISVALGWLTAGRALRPIRAMTDQARHISEHNLNQRLAVTGPDDEIKDLGDTFDGLLSRLDTAFAAQKHFVANASHELRTPLTLQRTLIEVTLADPHADPQTLRALCRRILSLGANQEHLIEALLTLASSQRGLDRREATDLAEVVDTALDEHHLPHPNQPTITADLNPAWTFGAPRLIERLAANLIDNAIQYNVPDGWIRLYTGVRTGRPVLRVTNSGPAIPPDHIDTLFQPFQRLQTRTADPHHHGIGLSIVAAIATAHHARIAAAPGCQGGLDITIAFPPAGRHHKDPPTAIASHNYQAPPVLDGHHPDQSVWGS
jgi:signal transduction histidine kinase